MTTILSIEIAGGTSTFWIPLTTPGPSFSQACSVTYFPPQYSSFIAAYDPEIGQLIPTLQCLAPQQTKSWFQSSQHGTTTLLGPFSCPSQYTTVTTLAINSLTTVVACCPSGYDYKGSIVWGPYADQCKSTLTAGQTLAALTGPASSLTYTTMTVGSASSLVVAGIQANGYEFGGTSTTSSQTISQTSTSQAGAIPSATLSIASTNTASTTPTAAASSGLSSGAKAGIGVGVAIVAVALLGLLITLLFRHRKRAKSAAQPAELASSQGGYVHEKPSEMFPSHNTAVSHGQWRSELPEQHSRAELDGAARRANFGSAEL